MVSSEAEINTALQKMQAIIIDGKLWSWDKHSATNGVEF